MSVQAKSLGSWANEVNAALSSGPFKLTIGDVLNKALTLKKQVKSSKVAKYVTHHVISFVTKTLLGCQAGCR